MDRRDCRAWPQDQGQSTYRTNVQDPPNPIRPSTRLSSFKPTQTPNQRRANGNATPSQEPKLLGSFDSATEAGAAYGD